MLITRRAPRLALLFLLALFSAVVSSGRADDKSGKLRFGVGPLQPTPTETKKAYEPFFAYIAKQLNREQAFLHRTNSAAYEGPRS